MTSVESDLTSGIFPWQEEQWQSLIARRDNQRLPHALLFTGLCGLGKNHFANTLTQALLCVKPRADGLACNTCRSCLLYLAGTHPDYLFVRPLEEGKIISVDQIRDMNEHLVALTSQYAGFKIVIIAPAERMNSAAANSLLKTLEEPPPKSLLILISSQPAILLATVRSRCQEIRFSPPPAAQTIHWLSTQPGVAAQISAQLLAIAGGAPLVALTLAASDTLARRSNLLRDLTLLVKQQADPPAIAADWLQGNVTELLTWLQSCLADMIKLHCVATPPYVANADILRGLRDLAQQLDIHDIYVRLDSTTEALRLLTRQANVQLLLEDLLIQWSDHPALTHNTNRVA